MKFRSILLNMAGVITGIILLCGALACGAGARIPTWQLSFEGNASGGSLVLAKTRNRTVKFVSIETSPGESPASVAQRLADTINAHHARQSERLEYDVHWLWMGGFKARASDGSLTLPLGPSSYILGGTENGLGIPRPPLFLSASYDDKENEVVLHWANENETYDFILVKVYWSDFDNTVDERVGGTVTSFTIDRNKLALNMDDADFRVIGFKGGIPSNAAGIHVTGKGHCQEETFGLPFARGLAPNWEAWSTSPEKNQASFLQREKYSYARSASPATALSTKPFVQVIKAPGGGVTHGVYRKFLGLKPGHTYRLFAALSTLNMDSAGSEWSFALCAAPGGAATEVITAEQLAGIRALPDGRSGPQAGLIAAFTRGNTTKGNFQIVFSRTEDQDLTDGSHITLPVGVDSLVVWARFECEDPNGEVGLSGVRLEDLTAIVNPKTTEQILDEEADKEVRFLRHIEKTLRIDQ